MKCPTCREGTLAVTHETHLYLQSDPRVVLRNVEIRPCSKCGERLVGIQNAGPLNEVIALAVIGKNGLLTPGEVSLLRAQMGMTGVQFAKRMGVTPSTASRWESGAKEMGAQSDRLLRLMVARHLRAPFDLELLDKIEPMAAALHLDLEFVGGKWTHVGAPAAKRSKPVQGRH